MKTLNIVLGVSLIVLLLGCSSDNSISETDPFSISDSGTDNELKIVYPDSRIEAYVFDSGQSESPEIDWDGKEGIVSLEKGQEGVSIDASTGVISWDNSLGLGIYFLTVRAENGLNTKWRKLVLDVRLGGDFKIKYNTYPKEGSLPNPEFRFEELRFSKEGSVYNSDFPVDDDYIGKWSWVDQTHIKGYFYLQSSDGDKIYRTFYVELKNNDVLNKQIKFIGEWYNHVPGGGIKYFTGEPGGYIEIEFYQIR